MAAAARRCSLKETSFFFSMACALEMLGKRPDFPARLRPALARLVTKLQNRDLSELEPIFQEFRSGAWEYDHRAPLEGGLSSVLMMIVDSFLAMATAREWK